jgi:hypothetical protein
MIARHQLKAKWTAFALSCAGSYLIFDAIGLIN